MTTLDPNTTPFTNSLGVNTTPLGIVGQISIQDINDSFPNINILFHEPLTLNTGIDSGAAISAGALTFWLPPTDADYAIATGLVDPSQYPALNALFPNGAQGPSGQQGIPVISYNYNQIPISILTSQQIANDFTFTNATTPDPYATLNAYIASANPFPQSIADFMNGYNNYIAGLGGGTSGTLQVNPSGNLQNDVISAISAWLGGDQTHAAAFSGSLGNLPSTLNTAINAYNQGVQQPTNFGVESGTGLSDPVVFYSPTQVASGFIGSTSIGDVSYIYMQHPLDHNTRQAYGLQFIPTDGSDVFGDDLTALNTIHNYESNNFLPRPDGNSTYLYYTTNYSSNPFPTGPTYDFDPTFQYHDSSGNTTTTTIQPLTQSGVLSNNVLSSFGVQGGVTASLGVGFNASDLNFALYSDFTQHTNSGVGQEALNIIANNPSLSIFDQVSNWFSTFLKDYATRPQAKSLSDMIAWMGLNTATTAGIYTGSPLITFLENSTSTQNQTITGIPDSADFLRYQSIFTALFPTGTTITNKNFATTLSDFVNKQLVGSGAPGFFVPSQDFAPWTSYLQNIYFLGHPELQAAKDTLLKGMNADKVLILIQIYNIISSLLNTVQEVAQAQANRLIFLSQWQRAYTDLASKVPTFTAGHPLSDGQLGSEQRTALNQQNSTYRGTISTFQSLVGDDSKALQSNLNQTNDAVNQQSNFGTSLIQELTTILGAIFR